MRKAVLVIFANLACLTTSIEFSPFLDPILETFQFSPREAIARLQKRQDCPLNHSNCDGLDSGACCPSGTTCTTDTNNHVACCPINAACTGTIGAGTSATGSLTTTGGIIVGGSTTTASSRTSALTASSTSNSATTTSNGVSVVSVVPNSYFPFAYIPTAFSNSGQCSSYFTSCQSEFSSCTASLGGGVNGVTVSGLGGGVTVAGTTASGTANAQSICSSLSSVACHGLQSSSCSVYGSGTGNNFVTAQATNSAAARITGCPGQLFVVGGGIAVGMAGAMI